MKFLGTDHLRTKKDFRKEMEQNRKTGHGKHADKFLIALIAIVILSAFVEFVLKI